MTQEGPDARAGVVELFPRNRFEVLVKPSILMGSYCFSYETEAGPSLFCLVLVKVVLGCKKRKTLAKQPSKVCAERDFADHHIMVYIRSLKHLPKL